ncbi:hypothetical protein LOTGIDRAFT_236059 [Lottia gigantea]|uniref:Uncharacterized protein n=1 Tax=Lottia gigantea TaxID=225164 RepID=V4B822_LOTGI|nr:hypothetical protein LOTGIDRAFT_236059 [Lottia gigantea]ESO84829.1 hypothetical protein LOTGIDRAFT_236059 [Lottia gigantea]
MYRRGARPPKDGVEKIVGYVTVQPDKNDDSDNESDDDDEEWLDEREMTAISLGGTLMKQTPAKNQRITIKTFGQGKKYVVKGRFPLHDPWWKITCFIYRNKSIPNMYFVDHTRPILYDIRTDELVVTHKLMNICLTTTQEPYFGNADERELWNEKLSALDKYVCDHPNESVYFDNMKNLLKNFDEVCKKYETSPIGELVDRCDAVRLVYGAVEFPQLFTFLAQLLPKKFTEIIKLGSQRLKKLDNCREEYTWEFAFSNKFLKGQIMFKQYGMIGVEASLYDYLRCDLLNDMPSMNCDAIYIYDFLKKDARESGHTFIEKFRVRKSQFTCDHQVVNWDASLKYLEQHRIIKTEGKDQTTKIFLRRNWEAERDVAKTLGVMLKDAGSYCENDLDIDFTSSDFKNIHNDVDQWRAAHLIASNPVAVLSGKGGCGKTTVVTQLLKHVCENSQSKVSIVAPIDSNEEPANLENGQESILNDSLDQTSSSDTTQSTQFYRSPWKSYRQMTQEAEEWESSEDDSDDDDDDHYLSKTPLGQTILLTAPTGKAANLLGRKVCMESVTLHHVMMSYKGFCKRKADYLREMNKPDPNRQKRAESSDEESDDNDLDNEDEFMQTQNKFQNQNQNNSNDEQNHDNFFDSEDVDSEAFKDEAMKKEIDPEMPVWKYENKSVLVVDECSLVSVKTIATVMNNLRRQARLKKVILLGDVRQLPSVEPGNFLADIFRVLYPIGCCMELRTNHRAESELIVNNASKISLMKLPQYDNSKFQLRLIDETDDENEIDKRIQHLLRTSTDLNQETSQFVSFQRRRCESINELCCKFYNKHVTKDSKRKYLFQVGDKVCLGKNAEVMNHKERLPKKEKASKKKNEGRKTQKIVRNGKLNVTEAAELTLLDSEDESSSQTESKSKVKPKKKPIEGLKKEKKNNTVKLCNGEIFFIMKDTEEHNTDGKSTRYLILSDKEQPKEKLVCVNYKDLVNKCKMRHGWARTIHTYQGSESSAVVYVVYRSYYENWQHVYTAVTRGRNSVYMVGKKSCIDKAIRTDKKERRTSLKEKLIKRVEKFPEILQKQRENLKALLLESDAARQRKIIEGEDGETDLFGSDDDNDNYINALCDLLPPSQSSSEDNSEGTVLNMKKCALQQTVACEINSNKGDNSELIEDESSSFDSDDSYMKTLDESAFILSSQIQQASQFTQCRNHETSQIQVTPENINGQSGCITPNKENAFKRLSSAESEHESRQKFLRVPDPSILVSPVRRCLERTLSFPKD